MNQYAGTSFNRRAFMKKAAAGLCLFAAGRAKAAAAKGPNFVLVMADDQGWGEMGYYKHPHLKTPNLDAMAANGLRFDRFYAGAPNCSPTRASVMTGRTPMRTGVQDHGFPLRKQERTVARALQEAGYTTGHFGKWHLNGLRGPGVPVQSSDARHPGEYGFDTWLSVTNFFDLDPLMAREGKTEAFKGDTSEIIVGEALKFIEDCREKERPFLCVIWYGSPHSPFAALPEDAALFPRLPEKQQQYFGELAALDRSMGALRKGLRKLAVAENTLVWYCSDNGGVMSAGGPATNGGLRGAKNSVWEGGLRVPGIIEWPAGVAKARITKFPACTMDIFPTLAELAGLPESALLAPLDGMSLKPLLAGGGGRRAKPIPFLHKERAAFIDNDYKMVNEDMAADAYQLYHLGEDPVESRDLAKERPEIAAKMRKALEAWYQGVQDSIAGRDYPAGRLTEPVGVRKSWSDDPAYKQFG